MDTTPASHSLPCFYSGPQFQVYKWALASWTRDRKTNKIQPQILNNPCVPCGQKGINWYSNQVPHLPPQPPFTHLPTTPWMVCTVNELSTMGTILPNGLEMYLFFPSRISTKTPKVATNKVRGYQNYHGSCLRAHFQIKRTHDFLI